MIPSPTDYGRRQADAVRARGGSAMDVARAHIAGAFSPYTAIHATKEAVRLAIRRGPCEPDNVIRYGWVCGENPRSATIDTALAVADARWRAAQQMMLRRGLSDRLIVQGIPAEARLLLRFARRARVRKREAA